MKDDLTGIIGSLGDWLAGGGSILLITDYDGTLVPIVGNPGDARVSDDVRAHLRAVAASPRSRLALISGRDLADLRARVPVPRAIYAGCHGLEVEGPDLAFTHPEAEAQRDRLRAVSFALCLGAPFVEGMRVEPKRLGVAIHYRHVAAAAQHRVETMLARSLRRPGSQFKVFHGAKVIEVLPHVEWSKGQCVLWIRDRIVGTLPPPVMVLYLGDDWTDEPVFEALAGQAVTVRVGTDVPASRATHRLSGVSEVGRLVSALATDITAGRT